MQYFVNMNFISKKISMDNQISEINRILSSIYSGEDTNQNRSKLIKLSKGLKSRDLSLIPKEYLKLKNEG